MPSKTDKIANRADMQGMTRGRNVAWQANPPVAKVRPTAVNEIPVAILMELQPGPVVGITTGIFCRGSPRETKQFRRRRCGCLFALFKANGGCMTTVIWGTCGNRPTLSLLSPINFYAARLLVALHGLRWTFLPLRNGIRECVAPEFPGS